MLNFLIKLIYYLFYFFFFLIKNFQKWIEWKNNMPRYDSGLDFVPQTFAPEQDYYLNSIMALGTPLFLIGSIILFIAFLFLFFRYILGRRLGKEKRNMNIISRFKRHCTLATFIIGVTLWFIGMVIALTGTMRYKYFE